VNLTRERALEQLRRMVLGALAERDAAVWLFSCDVDLVDLRRADAALVDEVRREGVKWRG
jgi:hypothetical protein